MAIGAQTRRHQVRVGQRETGGRVIELAIRPLNRIVTGFTRCRETSRSVSYWRGRVVVIRLVASHASSARQAVIVVDVTIRA